MENEADNQSQQRDEIEVLEAIYGADWHKDVDSDLSYSVQISTDVKLFLTLNDSYPSAAPPTYLLLAPCLTKEVKQVIAQAFEEIYLDNIGDAVLFQWIEKLKEIVAQKTDVCPPTHNDNKTVIEKPVEKISLNKSQYNITHGPIIQDRKSTFQGHACVVKNEADVRNVMSILLENKKIYQATHNILAYKIQQPSGFILQDCDDDGEAHAGGRLLHLLQILNVKNIMVVVSRWYGGIHLGPDRFRHINNAARQVLQSGGFIE